jgi:hypothetical protein
LGHLIPLFFLFGLGLLASILVAIELGRRFGIRYRKRSPKAAGDEMRSVDGAIFGLMALLIGFTFSGALSRFDARRDLIIQEANAIGTAFLRIKLLPTEYQPGMQEKFRQYLDARIAAYQKVPDLKAAKAELQRVGAVQLEIWADAVSACMETRDPTVKLLVLSSLNEMFDLSKTRTERSRMHPPPIITVTLIALVLTCSLLAGNAMAGRETHNWFHVLLFSTILTMTVLLVLDLEYPRIGAIRIDDWDQVFIELRASMK